VLRAAIEVADSSGIESLTMRRLAEELGAEAMSLYYYVASKEDLLDGVADAVVAEINDVVAAIDAPAAGASWKAAVRRRILAAREVLLRHRWAPRVLETRTSASLAVLSYYDGLLRLMRDGGFSYDLIHHALHALGSRALGASRQAATANRRSSVSPAFLALRAPASTQALQPLTWLTRRWTSSSVAGGTPPSLVALSRAWMGAMASGRIIAGFFIRACMVSFFRFGLLLLT